MSSEFGDEWKRRRERRNKELTSIWKLIFRIVALILLILLIKFLATGGWGDFLNIITNSNKKQTEIYIQE